MTIKIKPSEIKGKVNAPASKSMAHRLLICAGLSNGTSVIKNVSYSEDILATLDCLKSMGAKIKKDADTVTVTGVLPKKAKSTVYSCRESGSTLRFFIPLAMLSESESTFTGYGRLMQRPMSVYEKLAQEKGIAYEKNENSITVGGVLSAGEYSISADVSSQFISGLLFALPLCDGDSVIKLTGTIESKSYIDLTLQSMESFGVKAIWQAENEIFIKGNQQYKTQNLTVEGDYSNAAFSDAFNYIGGNVMIFGLNENSLQGDKIYKKYFEMLKSGVPTLDIRNCPDLAPILMALASELNGAVLTGTRRLKIKESDRGAVMKQEISKFGADIEVYDDEIIIRKSILKSPTKILNSHNDHRVVMSLAVLCSKYGGEIENADAVKKSYPDFFSEMKKLGMEAEEYDN